MCIDTLILGATTLTLGVTATVMHHTRRTKDTTEDTHRGVCATFQVLWILCTFVGSLFWKADDVFPWSAGLLLGYFVYDALALLAYTQKVAVLYFHHTLCACLSVGACLVDRVDVYHHLIVLALCLEMVNPLLNVSWMIRRRHRRTSGVAFRLFGACILLVFVLTRFALFSVVLWSAFSLSPVLAVGMSPFAALSGVWFVHMCHFYLLKA